MKEAKRIPITVMGHKAKIRLIGFGLGIPPAWHGDHFTVWIDLEDPIQGLSGFGIEVSINDNYSKKGFIETVELIAEERVKTHIDAEILRTMKYNTRKIKEESLQTEVDRIKHLIGM